jgi:hypothetical protein
MQSPSIPIARSLTPSQIRQRVEAELAAKIVSAPATAPTAEGALIPGLGYMPSPGHLAMPTPVDRNLFRYLFAR